MNSYTVTLTKKDYTPVFLTTNCYEAPTTGEAEGYVNVSIHGANCGTFGLTPDHLREFAANLLKVAEEVEAINAKIPA